MSGDKYRCPSYSKEILKEMAAEEKKRPFGFARGIELQEIEVIGNIYQNPDLLP